MVLIMITFENLNLVLLWSTAISVALMVCVCFVRAVLGPRSTDRIISINVICTKVIILIAVLAYLLGEESLLDVAIVYAMINFLAVVVLYKCYPLIRRSSAEEKDHDDVHETFYDSAERRRQNDDA